MGRQLGLRLGSGRGGRRRGAGRKPAGERAGVRHERREGVSATVPLHVTVKAVRAVGSLRARRLARVVCTAIWKGQSDGFRIAEYSIQDDHVHLIVEVADAGELARGMRGLGIRVAKGVNGVLERSGRVIADRYHARRLSTPLEVRNALRYVLQNRRKHRPDERGLDPLSSAGTFDGWCIPVAANGSTPCITSRARTWLLRAGWRRRGLLHPGELPRSS